MWSFWEAPARDRRRRAGWRVMAPVVTVNDRRSAEEMSAARSALAGTPVNWVLGSHPVEILDTTDILCISGGIPLDNPLVIAAMQRGIPLTNDTQIFMEVSPLPDHWHHRFSRKDHHHHTGRADGKKSGWR